MRWEGREESVNVEDRRGMAMPAGGLAAGGGLGMLVLMIIVAVLGGDPTQLLSTVDTNSDSSSQLATRGIPSQNRDADLKSFVSVVMKDTEDVWGNLFRNQLRARYHEPTLVLFDDYVRSACGNASSQVGPFYCPTDSNVYLDMSFFRQLKTELGAPGDFAMAYVIAHEVAHHVQNQLSISDQVQAMQAKAKSDKESKQWSVRLELQADYLAGVWMYHAQKMKQIMEQGDKDEALNAATRIGDDVLQRRAAGKVNKDAFTHGSAKQRRYFLAKGLETGDLEGMMDVLRMSQSQLDNIGN